MNSIKQQMEKEGREAWKRFEDYCAHNQMTKERAMYRLFEQLDHKNKTIKTMQKKVNDFAKTI